MRQPGRRELDQVQPPVSQRHAVQPAVLHLRLVVQRGLQPGRELLQLERGHRGGAGGQQPRGCGGYRHLHREQHRGARHLLPPQLPLLTPKPIGRSHTCILLNLDYAQCTILCSTHKLPSNKKFKKIKKLYFSRLK